MVAPMKRPKMLIVPHPGPYFTLAELIGYAGSLCGYAAEREKRFGDLAARDSALADAHTALKRAARNIEAIIESGSEHCEASTGATA